MPNTSAPRGLASQQSESMLDGPHQRRLFHLVKRQHARVEILTGEILLLPYEKSSTLLDLFTETCKYCSIAEQDYFGLAIRESGSEWYQFVDLSKKVSKFERKKRLVPKIGSQDNSNGSSHTNGNGNVSSTSSVPGTSGAPLFHFRLAYYVPCHVLPRDRGTKRQYYLQLRRNLREFSLLQTDEQIVSLVLYALQADYGSFGSHLLAMPSDSIASHVSAANSNVAGGERYFDPARYFPRWMLDKFGEAYFLTHVPPLHAGLKAMSRSEAEFHFIRECSSLAATSYNMHLYRLQRLNSASGWLSAASSLLNVSLRSSSKVRRSASAKRTDSNSVSGATPSSTRTPISMKTSDTAATSMWLGISPNGLELFERTLVDSVGYRSHVSSIAWNEIGKLRFKKTRLEVRVLVDSGSKKQPSTAAEAPSRRPVSASFHMQDLQLAPEAVSQSVQPRHSLLNSSANSAGQPSPSAERVLLFCTDSTAQSAQILELTKLQHVFQLKASLRAPQTADAIELAERARYRESLISTASIRDRANRVRADAEAARRLHNDRTSQRVCVSVNLDALNQSLPPPPPPPPQTQTAQHVRSGRGRTSTSPRMSNRRSMHEPITAAAVTQPTASNVPAPPVCVDMALRRRSQSPISMSTVTTASSTTTPNTVIEQRSAASISLTASPVSLPTQPRPVDDMLTHAEPDCEAAAKAVRAASEDESGLGTLEPEHGSDSPASDAERAAIELQIARARERELAIDSRTAQGSAPLLAPICADSASPPASDGQDVRSSRKMDGARNSQAFTSLNDDTLTASSALKSWKSLNEQLNLASTNSQAEA